MSLIGYILSFFLPKIVPLPTETISSSDMWKIINQTLLVPHEHNSDEEYRAVPLEWFKIWLAINPVSERTYVPIKYDCDDFSFELMGCVRGLGQGYAFGIVWGDTAGSGHAWNWFMDEDWKLWFLEPQNDNIFEPTTEKVWFMMV